MRLASGDGYACDRCWVSHKGDFTYYSANAYLGRAIDNRVPSLGRGDPTFSFDFCEACDEENRTLVVAHYKPTKRNQDGTYPAGIYCDITGKHMTGSFTIIHAVMDKVVVRMSGAYPACTKCGIPAADQTAACKCGNTTYQRRASVDVDKRNYEFTVCEEAYLAWRNRALLLRQNPETTKWSASPT